MQTPWDLSAPLPPLPSSRMDAQIAYIQAAPKYYFEHWAKSDLLPLGFYRLCNAYCENLIAHCRAFWPQQCLINEPTWTTIQEHRNTYNTVPTASHQNFINVPATHKQCTTDTSKCSTVENESKPTTYVIGSASPTSQPFKSYMPQCRLAEPSIIGSCYTKMRMSWDKIASPNVAHAHSNNIK